jgi:hypothetical protein
MARRTKRPPVTRRGLRAACARWPVEMVATPRHRPSPRGLTLSVHQPPLFQAVIRTACSRPNSIMVPHSLLLAWASRVVSLRAAPIEHRRAKASHIVTGQKRVTRVEEIVSWRRHE